MAPKLTAWNAWERAAFTAAEQEVARDRDDSAEARSPRAAANPQAENGRLPLKVQNRFRIASPIVARPVASNAIDQGSGVAAVEGVMAKVASRSEVF
jgi:hypothetical protein